MDQDNPVTPANQPVPIDQTTPVDTQDIIDVYLRRPQTLLHWGVGKWFTAAHEMQDPQLRFAITVSEAKRLILEKGYTSLSLEPLHAFNAEARRGIPR